MFKFKRNEKSEGTQTLDFSDYSLEITKVRGHFENEQFLFSTSKWYAKELESSESYHLTDNIVPRLGSKDFRTIRGYHYLPKSSIDEIEHLSYSSGNNVFITWVFPEDVERAKIKMKEKVEHVLMEQKNQIELKLSNLEKATS